jgi:hypothetical protein
MKNKWLLDVLTDLSEFSRANGLEQLSTQLHRTREVALIELAAASTEAPLAMPADETTVGANT